MQIASLYFLDLVYCVFPQTIFFASYKFLASLTVGESEVGKGERILEGRQTGGSSVPQGAPPRLADKRSSFANTNVPRSVGSFLRRASWFICLVL